MRVLFLQSDNLWIHTLPEAFSELGHKIKISGSLKRESIPEMISDFKPDLIISIGWGPEQTKEKQYWMQKYIKPSKVPHVYWSVEDPAFTEVFSIPLIKRVKPDFVFSISLSTVEYFRKSGIKAAHMDFGVAPKIHRPTRPYKRYKSRVAVVANAYPAVLDKYPQHYRHESLRTLIYPLVKKNIHVEFWGREWSKMSQFGYDIPQKWIHGHLPYPEANKIYSSSDIIIGLQNYPDQLTQRTYEILASGGFLLTSDTPAVRQIFNPGKNLVVSSSADETLRLIDYYLGNPEERKKISMQGILDSEKHCYTNRAINMLKILRQEKILEIPF